MPFCENCGNKVSDTTKFCSNCGGKIIVAEDKISTQNKSSELHEEINPKNKNLKNNNIVEKISDTDKTQIQASSIFYFTGRIGRLQYGLSVVIFLLISSLIFVLEMNGSLPKISFWIFFYPAIFILIAQSVKRCHDVGISGWFTLIPIISVFYLLFARGIKNNNNFIGHKEIEEKEDDIEDDIEEESPIKPKDGGGLR